MKTSEKLLLERFNQLIESNFHNPEFGIEDICHELGTSRSQLYRHIKEQTQLSISLYIRQRKLFRAKWLLETSDMKTAEIAYQLGIDSPQNFSKYFAQEFGMTPTAYRRIAASQAVAAVGMEEPETMGSAEGDSGETSGNDLPPARPQNTRAASSVSKRLIYGGIGLILVLALAVYFLKPFQEKTEEETILPDFRGNSIAILPFKNTGTPENSYFTDGVVDQIHGSLSLIQRLKVISTTSSGKYKDSPKQVPEIARELDVNYILVGSVFKDEEKMKVHVGLVRAIDDRTVWTKSYEGNGKDVFAYLSNVAGEVARELDQKLSAATAEKLRKVPTSNAEAYKAYLQGMQLVLTRKREPMTESIVRLEKAVELDPNFAAAYASLGHAYYLMSESGLMEEEQATKMTEKNSLTAIRLDAENGLAYANLANIYRNQHKWEQAKTAYQIALKYNSNDALINYWYSLLLRSTGHLTEAIAYSSRATALDPLHHVIFGGHILNYVYAGDLSSARKGLDDSRMLFGDLWTYRWIEGVYYGVNKEYKKALASYARADQINPGIRSIQYQTLYFKALDGQIDEVHSFLQTLPDIPENHVPRACIYAGLKDKKLSLYYLQKAADGGILPTDIKVSPYLALLHDEPAYQAILRQFGL
jgi:adenylate cyclase